jgi:hypothetical protein
VDLVIGDLSRRFDVAVDGGLEDTAFQKPIAEAAANAVGGVLVVRLMAHDREERVEAPLLTAGIDMIVECDQACVVVFAVFAKQVRVNVPADASEILGENEIKLTLLDEFDGATIVVAFKRLTTPLTGQDNQVEGQLRIRLEPASIGGLLIGETLLVLVNRADAADAQDAETSAIACDERRIEKGSHEALPDWRGRGRNDWHSEPIGLIIPENP